MDNWPFGGFYFLRLRISRVLPKFLGLPEKRKLTKTAEGHIRIFAGVQNYSLELSSFSEILLKLRLLFSGLHQRLENRAHFSDRKL